jgi:YbbR domain-containing protein
LNRQPDQKEYIANEGRSDYVVTRNHRTDVIAFILSLLAAIILWGYVSINNVESTVPVVFSSVQLQFVGEDELKENYSLIVQSVDTESISVTLTGNSTDVTNLNSSSVTLEVDLSSISAAGIYSLPVVCHAPDKFTYSLSTESVTVNIDKPDSKMLTVDSDNIQLMGWIKETGCTIVNQSLNITKVKLEGNTLNLEKVAGVQIRTASIGVLNASMNVSAEIYLLDAEGNDLDLPITVSSDAGRDGIVVSLTVYKEKTLDLTVRTKYGYLNSEQLLVEPSQVMVYGEASVVDELNELTLDLDEIDEKQIFADITYTGVQIQSADDLIITKVDQSPFEGATVQIRVSECDTKTIRADHFVLLNAPDNVSIQEEYLLLNIRTRLVNDANVMLNLLSQNSDRITLYVDYESVKEDGSVPVVVFFSDNYRSYLYEIGSYTVNLVVQQPDVLSEGQSEEGSLD